MEREQIIDTIRRMCHNGTRSSKVSDILKATGATKLELYEALTASELDWRVGININKVKLIVLDSS